MYGERRGQPERRQENQAVCEFIGGPHDGLLRVLRNPKYYNGSNDTEVRAYWVETHYVSPGVILEA